MIFNRKYAFVVLWFFLKFLTEIWQKNDNFIIQNLCNSESVLFSIIFVDLFVLFFLQIMVTDLRTVSFDVPPQEILTKDSVTVAVDAVVYYRISSPLSAVCNVADFAKSTKLLASTTLRTVLGTKNLAEILSDRETIATHLLDLLDTATDPWGVKVNFFLWPQANCPGLSTIVKT